WVPPMSEALDRLVIAAKIPRDARVLTIGRASPAAKNQFDLALENHKGPRITVDDATAEGDKVAGDPFTIALPGDISLCFVSTALSRIPDTFEELLHERLSAAVQPDGLVVLQFCRDVSDDAFEKLKLHENVRTLLRDFLQTHFGNQAVSAEDLATKFQNDGGFAFAGLASRTNRPAEEEALVWVLLRRRATGDTSRTAFPRTPRADRFRQDEVANLVATLKNSGTGFVAVDQFAERLKGAPGAVGLVKLDIHHSIRRALELGRLLKEQNVQGLYLIMHRHALSADYYDAPYTWEVLRELAGMGHEIGLHLDPFHMIREYGDLYKGTEEALADMRGRGLTIRAATLHGDTAVHLRARKLFAYDFFTEMKFRSTWDGEPPSSEPVFAEHVGRYSFKTLAEQHGLRWFAEANFVADGAVISTQPLAYLTDNRKTMMVLNTPAGDISDAAPFRVSEDFASRAAEALKDRSFLALFHPQWVW
ncbi:MAG TPA: hypothetical protein VHE09_16405, partial [Rhizomicrobium sp.]|nr:hypothetical protein [Rhizomicrobium sp.]